MISTAIAGLPAAPARPGLAQQKAEAHSAHHPAAAAAASVLVGAALCLGVGLARAEIIDLQWQDGDRFERSLVVAPGKFAELCGPLDQGQHIRWSFKADRALNFNIHYHLDKDARYPVKQDQVRRLQGDLLVAARQDHCWMWVNKAKTAAQLSVTLTRK